jgi:hypothetical protein
VDPDSGDGKEIAEWFETFLKVVCWNYGLEPNIPYHDLANQVVNHLTKESTSAKDRPWRKKK